MKKVWDIMQVCIVVKDLRKYVGNYWEKLGIGPWKLRHFTNEIVREYKVDGKPVEDEFDFHIATCQIGRVEFEIIQPVKGPNCYFRFLEEKGEGLHHVKVPIEKEEVGEMVRYFEAGGNPILQTGWVDGDFHAYPDTQDDLAMMIELGVPGPIDVPYELYPPEAVSKEV